MAKKLKLVSNESTLKGDLEFVENGASNIIYIFDEKKNPRCWNYEFIEINKVNKP